MDYENVLMVKPELGLVGKGSAIVIEKGTVKL